MILKRHKKTNLATLGYLYLADKIFCTLENPWFLNKTNISCCPAGSYNYQIFSRSASGKYKPCILIKEVPNRSGILIHNGNIAAHTRGCILVGSHHGHLGGQPAVLNSRSAMRDLFNLLANQHHGKILIM